MFFALDSIYSFVIFPDVSWFWHLLDVFYEWGGEEGLGHNFGFGENMEKDDQKGKWPCEWLLKFVTELYERAVR